MIAPSLRRFVLALGLLAALLAPLPVTAAEPTVAVRWNQALLQAVRNTGMAPMFVARALAMVHTSMYDAWAAYDGVAVGTRLVRRAPAPSGRAQQGEPGQGGELRRIPAVDPNHWQPLLNPSGTTPRFLAPHWGLVTPFALDTAEAF